MIIYGWGYFNRRDHSVVRGGCPSCGRGGYMKSYTSSKFFTLYFIPLIPLGTQKIVKECPHCKAALGMPLRKFRKLRETELPRLVTEYESKPADAEAAKNVLGAIINLQDRGALRRVGPQIRRAFERDADMMGLLASTHSYLCLDKEADELFLAAVALSDDKDLAAEANAHIESQKLPKPTPPNRLLQSAPVLIVPAALLFLLTMFVQRAASSRLDEAYVVNGLDRVYAVEINGEKITLGPRERISGEMLQYGANTITPVPEAAFVEAATFQINTPWYQRPFGGPLVVVNPDRAAVMLWERTGYSEGNVPDSAYQYKLATGQVLHSYRDIDYPFGEFPGSISASKGSGLHYRHRVSVFEEKDPQKVIAAFLHLEKPDQIRGYLQARLRAAGDEPALIFAGAQYLPREEFLRLAETRLAERPVLIQWHRAFQSQAEKGPEGRDLVARYRAMVEREPENSALLYLLGRVTKDPDDCVALYRRAAAVPQPCAYAPFAVGYRQMIDGDHAAALASFNEALRLDPGNVQFASVRHAALLGLRQYEQLETEALVALGLPDPAVTDLHAHLYRLAKLGRTEDARAEIAVSLQKHQARHVGEMTDQDVRTWSAYLTSAIALGTGNRAAYATATADIDYPAWKLQRALVAGELDEALRLAAANPDETGVLDHFVLYVLLDRAGRTAESRTELEEAIKLLAVGGAEQRQWAEWLRDDVAPDPRHAAHACDDVDTHYVYLCGLAQRFPARASEYLARAAALKCVDTSYSLALSELLPLQ